MINHDFFSYYWWRYNNDNGVGNSNVEYSNPITNYADVIEIEKEIMKTNNFSKVIILYWREYK